MEKYFDIILDLNKGNSNLWNKVYQIETTLLQKNHEKHYLGNSNYKKCRFCGKDSKETNFKMKAHIIPEFMGNKFCFSNYECDTCNQYFGTLEDSLFNFAGIHNVFSGVKGKKGFPKYKGNKEGLTLFAKSNNEIKVQTINTKDSQSFIHDKKNERIIVDTNHHSYIPQNAFKALVKIGLCMLSDYELKNYNKTLDWITSENTNENKNNPFFNVFKHVGGEKRFLKPWAILLKKRNIKEFKNIPHHTLLVFYGIIKYQLFLPFHIDEELITSENKLILPIEEHFINEKIENGEITEVSVSREHLIGIEKTKDKRHKFSVKFVENK